MRSSETALSMGYQSAHVTIIVLNWNGKDDTLECLESLSKLSYPCFDVIVVDNGSRDDSIAAIRARFPRITLIETGANLGFAEGNNVGIRRALANRAEHILILNNDTVVAPDMIDGFMEATHQWPHGGAFGAKIYYYSDPERIWYAGGRWDRAQMCFSQVGEGMHDLGDFDVTTATEFIIGCALFVPAAVFKEIGLLDPRYFLNYEEIDFCSRIKKAGYENVFVPKAKVWHKISASFGGEDSPLKTYFIFRNRLLWAERHLNTGGMIAIHLSVYSGFVSRFIRPLFQNYSRSRGLKALAWTASSALRNPNNRAWLWGIRDYWLRRFGPCPKQIWALQRYWKSVQQENRHVIR